MEHSLCSPWPRNRLEVVRGNANGVEWGGRMVVWGKEQEMQRNPHPLKQLPFPGTLGLHFPASRAGKRGHVIGLQLTGCAQN